MKAETTLFNRQLHYVQRLIQSATGTAETDRTLIESIMRDEMFHSTQVWQTEAQLIQAARLAVDRLNQNRAFCGRKRSRANQESSADEAILIR